MPATWEKELKVDVRWIVWDWSKSSEEEIKNANRVNARLEGIYRAIVPVEHYSDIGGLDVHFFPGGRVRVIAGETPRPIKRDDPADLAMATQGTRISELYTKAELEAEEKKTESLRKKAWRLAMIGPGILDLTIMRA